jgi:hypothetical protein
MTVNALSTMEYVDLKSILLNIDKEINQTSKQKGEKESRGISRFTSTRQQVMLSYLG